MSSSILNILNNPVYEDDAIVRLKYQTHHPYTSSTYNNNDEIRIPINQQDVFTFPHDSYLYILLEYTNNLGVFDQTYKLVSNAVALLFDEVRYEICGSEIDRIKNVGITTTMKNLLTIKPYEVNTLENAAWNENLYGALSPSEKISYSVFH